MSIINGVAKKYDGTAIDYVAIFNWSTGKCIAQVIPDSTGAWEYEYFYDLKVGITYVANGCKPITHGPYELQVLGYKWWRVKNIKLLVGSVFPDARSIAELRLVTNSGVESNTLTQAFSASIFGVGYEASKAFDNDISTMAHSVGQGVSGINGNDWYIGYEFATPQNVEVLKLQMRPDAQPSWKVEWQTADIEVSDDGLNWLKYGVVEPRIANMDLSLITTPVIKI